MVRQERIAWLNLSTVGLALFTFCVLSFVIGTHRALGAFGLLGLLGLIPVVYGPFKGGRVAFDERDKEILSNSLQIAYAVFWLVFVAGAAKTPFKAAPILKGTAGAACRCLGGVHN